jgi:hypothetical protein
MRFIRLLIAFQAGYILLTGVWPLIHITSFMAITGYKTDIWLVKTVGALLIPVGLCLGSFLFLRVDQRPAIILGSLTAVAFICIDFYYALNDVISDIYLLDGYLEIALLLAWMYVYFMRRYEKITRHY